MTTTKTVLPYTFEPISDEEKKERAKLYTGKDTLLVDMVRAMPGRILVPSKFQEIAEQVYNFDVRPDDVFMITYPKAGSTWTQEMVWQVTRGFDVEGGKENVFFRSPFFEMTMLCGSAPALPNLKSDEPNNQMAFLLNNSVQFTADGKSPRIIKTHLPLHMLPPNLLDRCRVMVVARNVKDSCVSWYNHEQILPVHGLEQGADFEAFARMYMAGNVLYGDYWSFLKDLWKVRDHPNVLFVWYEEMKADLRKVINRTAAFLKSDITEENVDNLLKHLEFNTFRNNPAVNHKPPKGAVPDEVRDKINFMPRGKVGTWKEFFTPELIKEWDAWIEKNNTDINIPIRFE